MLDYNPHFRWQTASNKQRVRHCLTELTCVFLLPVAYVVGHYLEYKRKRNIKNES